MDPDEPLDPSDDLLWKSPDKDDPYPWKLGNGKSLARNLRDLIEADPNFQGIWIGGKFIPNPKHVPEPDPPKKVHPLDPTHWKPYVSPFEGISRERLQAIAEDVGQSIKDEEAHKARIRSLNPKASPVVRVERPVKLLPKLK